MGISERPQSWFLQIRYKCTMLNMSCGCAGYMPGRAVRKKGRPQRPFCISASIPVGWAAFQGGASRFPISRPHRAGPGFSRQSCGSSSTFGQAALPRFFSGGHGGLSISAYRRCSRPAGFPPAGWRLSPEGDGQRFPPRYRTHRMVMSSEAALPSTWTDTSSSICRSTEAGSRDGEEARARIIASLE